MPSANYPVGRSGRPAFPLAYRKLPKSAADKPVRLIEAGRAFVGANIVRILDERAGTTNIVDPRGVIQGFRIGVKDLVVQAMRETLPNLHLQGIVGCRQ